MKYIVPLGVFVVLCVFLGIGLTRDPRIVPSPFIGKPAPGFTLTALHDPQVSFSPEQMKGKVWLLNVWASWCPACKIEHPVLNDMSRRGIVPIVGLNYKDQRADAKRWLQQNGDPYQLSVWDIDGKVGIDYGVYGAPETFVIDKQGVIRYKQIGPVTPEVLEKTLLPLIAKLNG
ncbi:MAG: DsbE family thiol:disulfide interchange protein [Rhizobiaceae bacterium]|nr:DsbE family thiol:disulfide interchange protein [Rhizobiaceae bacterium]